MNTGIEVHMTLPAAEANAFEQSLREQLRLALQDLWYQDRFRQVPAGLRTGAILAQYPALAAQRTTLVALKAAQREQRA
ncbi:hypothetical protein [Pseudomonas japonica]|uniref:hypothetical protein n=1 Tax=Pseudomonas japonica TaxID=256466 RepID=UPI002158FAD8|nr:hypothetical protein [Pseudomonas japonica]